MRIIAGKFRGRKLVCPRLVTRPTLDRVREALFSILGDLSDANVVDFYVQTQLMSADGEADREEVVRIWPPKTGRQILL